MDVKTNSVDEYRKIKPIVYISSHQSLPSWVGSGRNNERRNYKTLLFKMHQYNYVSSYT